MGVLYIIINIIQVLLKYLPVRGSHWEVVWNKLCVYRCRHSSSEAIIGWTVNGSSVGLFPDIISGSIRENGTLVYTLIIPARSEYSETNVVCMAFFSNGSFERTLPATLTIFVGTRFV